MWPYYPVAFDAFMANRISVIAASYRLGDTLAPKYHQAQIAIAVPQQVSQKATHTSS